MARASAEDVRDVLPHIDVPTLLVYGDRDVRAPLTVAEALRAAISGSKLVVLPDAGHVTNGSSARPAPAAAASCVIASAPASLLAPPQGARRPQHERKEGSASFLRVAPGS